MTKNQIIPYPPPHLHRTKALNLYEVRIAMDEIVEKSLTPKGFVEIPLTEPKQPTTMSQPQPRSWCSYISDLTKKATSCFR